MLGMLIDSKCINSPLYIKYMQLWIMLYSVGLLKLKHKNGTMTSYFLPPIIQSFIRWSHYLMLTICQILCW